MIITEQTIYWITRLDNIRVMSGCLLGASIIISIIIIIATCINWYDKTVSNGTERGNRLFILFILTFFISLLLTVSMVLIPTTKEMCVIKVLPVIANNKNIQELPNKVVDLANNWLEELNPKLIEVEN